MAWCARSPGVHPEDTRPRGETPAIHLCARAAKCTGRDDPVLPKALARNNMKDRNQRRQSGLSHNHHSHHFCVCWECKLHAKKVRAKISFPKIPGPCCPGRGGARTGKIRPEVCPSQARPCASGGQRVRPFQRGATTRHFRLHDPWRHGSIVRGTWALHRRARGPVCRRARSLAVGVQARLRAGRGRSTHASRFAT